MSLLQLRIATVALSFLGMGLYALAVPRRTLALFGVEAGTIDGRNEVRAVYGGFGVAIAGALVVALCDPVRLGPGILLAVAIALVGMAAGRVVSAVIERPARFFPTWLLLVVELALAALLLAP